MAALGLGSRVGAECEVIYEEGAGWSYSCVTEEGTVDYEWTPCQGDLITFNYPYFVEAAVECLGEACTYPVE
jgi:hypothetical protein